MKSEANQNENGSWIGLYGFFMNGGKDKNHVLNRLNRYLKMQFKNYVKFSNEHIKLDKFLPNYDIKEIAKDDQILEWCSPWGKKGILQG